MGLLWCGCLCVRKKCVCVCVCPRTICMILKKDIPNVQLREEKIPPPPPLFKSCVDILYLRLIFCIITSLDIPIIYMLDVGSLLDILIDRKSLCYYYTKQL